MSQSDRILEHLKSGWSITPLEALELYGCFRLGARIWGLVREGYKIKSEIIELPTGKRVAKYTMITRPSSPITAGAGMPLNKSGQTGELFPLNKRHWDFE